MQTQKVVLSLLSIQEPNQQNALTNSNHSGSLLVSFRAHKETYGGWTLRSLGDDCT